MEDNSSEENQPKLKTRGRKRCIRIDNSDSEDMNKNNDSNELENSDKENIENKEESDEIKNYIDNEKNEKQLELQKKLKFIFNEVREKGKYEYNKQEIPENLKYHSDESDSSEESGMKKSIISKKTDKILNDNNNDLENKKRNSFKKQISDRNSERQSGKLRKSKKSKDGASLASISSRKRSSNTNSDNKNKEITEFVQEDNLRKINEDREYENLAYEKLEKKIVKIIIILMEKKKTTKIIHKKNIV